MVTRGLTYILVLVVLLATLAIDVGRAGAEPYVFEAYQGARPREAEVVMQMLRNQLSVTELQADPSILAKKFAAHQFRPGIADAAYNAERFDNDVAAGMAAWSEANFAKAAERLERALTLVRENPMLLVRDIKTRNLVMRALLRLALTSRRYADTLSRKPARNAKAQANIDSAIRAAQERHKTAMAELIRSFGKTAITAETFGSEAAEQFREAVDALNSQGTGQMLVTTSDPSLTLYLNEQFEPNLLGKVRTNVAPGVYRVLAQARDRETREYSITVVANTLARLDIQMTADSLFNTATWVGFHDVGNAPIAEGELAAAMFKLQPEQTEVVVVSVTPTADNVAVYGTKYQVPTGRVICRGFVELDTATATKTNGDRLAQLVVFLRGGNDDPLRAVTIEKETRVSRVAARPPPAPAVVKLAPKAVVSDTATAAADKIEAKPVRTPTVRPAAPVLRTRDVDKSTAVGTLHPSRTASASTSAATTTSTPRGGRLAGKLLVAGGITAVLVGAVLVAIDEDPTGGGQAVANPTYRDSALPGVITMSAGAVSMGVGIWLWARAGGRPMHQPTSASAARLRRTAPLLTATNSQVVLGWTGSF